MTNRVITGALMGDPTPDYRARVAAAESASGDRRVHLDAELVAKDLAALKAAPPVALHEGNTEIEASTETPPGVALAALQVPGLGDVEPAPPAPPAGSAKTPVDPLRPIEPIQLHLEDPPGAPATEPPVFMDVDPRSLLIEPAYQRDLTPKSLALIRKIATEWDWRKFRPPVVVMSDDGGLVLDGQHTAIAAASRHDMPTIPVQLVDAPEVQDRAQAFIGLNTGQLGHTAVGLHKAALAAGDVTAQAVDRICKAAGVTIRQAYGGAKWRAGDTSAVGGVRAMLASVGEAKAVQILDALTRAGLAPISNTDMRAAEMLFTNSDYADQLSPLAEGGGADLAAAITALGPEAQREAKVFAKAQCVPLWRALGVVWFRKTRKRRKAA